MEAQNSAQMQALGELLERRGLLEDQIAKCVEGLELALKTTSRELAMCLRARSGQQA